MTVFVMPIVFNLYRKTLQNLKMKTIVAAGFIILLFNSCKKDRPICWECKLAGTYNGINYDGQVKSVCNDSEIPPVITDPGGNNITAPGGCTKFKHE